MVVNRSARRWIALAACTAMAAPLAGCFGGLEIFFNQTASLGGETVGGRGGVEVLIVNNTPFRAAFTAGTYDQADIDTVPVFQAFGLDDGDTALDGNDDDLFQLQCGRVFSVGGAGLHAALARNGDTDSLPEDAREVGVRFFSETQVDGETQFVEEGVSPPLERLLGTDFNCNSLLICFLEFDDVGEDRFRIEYRVIPAESTR